MNVIEIKNVNYERSGMEDPLRDINLTIKRGDFVHLKGLNGAGKSTITDFILGIREPDSGEIKVFGYSPGKLESKLKTGVTLQKLDTPLKQAGLDALIDLIESHYPGRKGQVRAFLKEFNFNLSDDKTQLAGGEERLLFISIAQVGCPEFLILDEPTTFLSDERRQELCEKLNNLAEEGKTILFISHIKDDIARLKLTKTIELDKGKVTQTQHREPYPQSSKPVDRDRQQIITLHWLNLLWKHIQFNIFQTLRTDRKYLWILLLSSFLYAVVITFTSQINGGQNGDNLSSIASAYSLYLAISATTSTGSTIALERQNEFLTKILKILPLPPVIYITAKVIASLLVSSLLILVMLLTTSICQAISLSGFHSLPDLLSSISTSCSEYLPLSLGFIFGIIPYLFLGLTLGYFLEQKSIQIIALLSCFSLALPIYARSILETIEQVIETPGKLNIFKLIGDNMTAHSPIYHYMQLILCMGNSSACDHYAWLHVSWLLWFIAIALLISLQAYKSVFKREAKA